MSAISTLFDLLEPQVLTLREAECSALENNFPFAEISMLAEAESWRKEIYRPIYHLHKWWAQRLGSVFRAIILAAALPETADVLSLFHQKNDLDGLVVFDPFMGSGTTIGEAVKLGCTAIGRDINPVAYNIVRAAFANVSQPQARRIFQQLEASVGERIKDLYRLKDGSQVLYYFWVKQIPCPACAQPVDLFNRYIFSQNVYPTRKPEAQCICPRCAAVFATRYDATRAQCPACGYGFNPQRGPAEKARATCPHCNAHFAIIEAARLLNGPPMHRMYAKIVLRADGEKEYRRITPEDMSAYAAVVASLEHEPPLIADIPLEPGHNTNQARNYGYTRWSQFFNARQLLALSWLGREIQALADPDVRLVFAMLFSGVLEFNNMFCSFKGEGTGAVRHIFAHHILKPEQQPLEANVWGTPKSSGAFSTLFESRLIRALAYRAAPFEVEVTKIGDTLKSGKRLGCNPSLLGELPLVQCAQNLRAGAIYLSCGDSAHTDLLSGSVDLVITDPPFFDNVHYSELADFFYAWHLPLLGDAGGGQPTTRSVREVQDQDAGAFAAKLADVFTECHRVLRNEGLLVFTYHHSREEGWNAIARAVTASGFCFMAAQPVKSEMSVAAPKQQTKEPIDLDIILVCRKADEDKRPYLPLREAVAVAQQQAEHQIEAFRQQARRLSRNDVRIITFAQLLVALSAGRSEDELLRDFENSASKML